MSSSESRLEGPPEHHAERAEVLKHRAGGCPNSEHVCERKLPTAIFKARMLCFEVSELLQLKTLTFGVLR